MKEVVIPKASLKPKPTPKQRRPLKSFKAQEINKASSKTPEPTKEFPLKQLEDGHSTTVGNGALSHRRGDYGGRCAPSALCALCAS